MIARKRVRRRITVLMIASSCFLVIYLSEWTHPLAQNQKTLPYRFLIPEGYVGLIRVDFNVSGAPPLPIEDGFYIFKFPESGRLQTSSSDIVESRRNEFLYYSKEGMYQLRIFGPFDERMVHGQASGPGPGQTGRVHRFRYIFIGPKDVFDRYQAMDHRLEPHEADGGPKVGARSWLTKEDLVRLKVRQP
jgi:hypothetical protein